MRYDSAFRLPERVHCLFTAPRRKATVGAATCLPDGRQTCHLEKEGRSATALAISPSLVFARSRKSDDHVLHAARLRTQVSSNARAFRGGKHTTPENQDSRLFYR